MTLSMCRSLFIPSTYHWRTYMISGLEEQPLHLLIRPPPESPDTLLSAYPEGYPEGDEDEDEEDEEDEEEEEHLAPADSTVIPTDEPVFPPEGTKPIIPPPPLTLPCGPRIYHPTPDVISHPPEQWLRDFLP
ncbi:hypothetical protein Tco_1315801 [Tanacetum coccineum]